MGMSLRYEMNKPSIFHFRHVLREIRSLSVLEICLARKEKEDHQVNLSKHLCFCWKALRLIAACN